MLPAIRGRIIAIDKLLATAAVYTLLSVSALGQVNTDLEPPAPPSLEIGSGEIAGGNQLSPPISQIYAGNAISTRLLRSRNSGTFAGPTIRTATVLEPSQTLPPTLDMWQGANVASTKAQLKAAATRSAQAQGVLDSGEATIAQTAYESAALESVLATPITDAVGPVAAEPNHLSIPVTQHIPTMDVYSYDTTATLSQPVATAYCDSAPSGCDTCATGTECDDCGDAFNADCSTSGGVGLIGGCLAAQGFYAPPLGSSVDAYLNAQVYGAQSAQFFMYRYDFFDRGDLSQLKEAGRRKLLRLAKSGWSGQSIAVEPVPGRPNLSASRKAAVEQFLQSQGISYSQVVLTHPDYAGLRGVEAVEIDRNQLQNTRSFGALGGGAGFGAGQVGTQTTGGQAQQGQQLRR